MRYDGTAANYIEKFKYALTSKKERARFPDDDEFAMLFSERQIYQMNSKNKVYILERLENEGRVLVIRPARSSGFSRTEKDRTKILSMYNDGYNQGILLADDVRTFYQLPPHILKHQH